jgi:5-methylcytosine-specific restriction protein A
MPSRWGKGRGGRPWRRLREAVMRRDRATCRDCGRVAPDGECDHIIPESQGGKTVIDNLQWLCCVCHRDKTAREAAAAQGRKSKPRIGVDGWPVG